MKGEEWVGRRTLTKVDALPGSLKHQPLAQEIFFWANSIGQATVGVVFLNQVLNYCR
jgi:hypothetical protein